MEQIREQLRVMERQNSEIDKFIAYVMNLLSKSQLKRVLELMAVQNAEKARILTENCQPYAVTNLEKPRIMSATIDWQCDEVREEQATLSVQEIVTDQPSSRSATGGCKDNDAATATQAAAQLRSSPDPRGRAVLRSPGHVDDSGRRGATKRSRSRSRSSNRHSRSRGPKMAPKGTAAKSGPQEEADNQASGAADAADAEKDEHAPQNILESYGYEAKRIVRSSKGGLFASQAVKVAIRIVQKKKAPKDYIENFLPREIMIKDLHHPQMVCFKELIETSNRLYIIMELSERGDLLDVMNRRKYVDEAQAGVWLGQMLDCISYISNNIRVPAIT